MTTGHRIKNLRKRLGLSLQSLSEQVGLTKGYLSKIERAGAPPPFSTLEKLAAVLGVDVNELLTGTQSEPGRNIDFLGSKPTDAALVSTTGICSYRPLLRGYRGRQMSPFMMIVQPGRTEAFRHDSEEFVYIISGKIELEYDGDRYVFETGDSFYLDSRLPHTFTNSSSEGVRLLAVDFNYRRF